MLAPTPKELLMQKSLTEGRILLVRHGQPAITLKPVTCHRGFGDYIQAYEQAGLDTESVAPSDLLARVSDIATVFSSGCRRSDESALALAPDAKLVADPLFAEAPLASPPIPLVRMTVSQWAVISRLLWHLGFHPGIESARAAQRRVARAADVLIGQMECDGAALLVAHGYFNFLLGRELRRRGFRRAGVDRARYWNALAYAR